MKKILIILIATLIMCFGILISEGESTEYNTPQGDLVQVCTYTFTNITTVSTAATSWSGDGCDAVTGVMDVRGAKSIQYSWIPNAVTHTATDWDVEAWTMDSPTGQAKYYTDMETAAGALATIGTHAADTQYDISNPSGFTFRYTYDGTGTDPSITATDPPVGSAICIAGFATANNGCFVVIATSTDYFEVYNSSGAAETNVVPGANNIASGTNAAGSDGLTTGHNYEVPKISENGALRVDADLIISVTKGALSW